MSEFIGVIDPFIYADEEDITTSPLKRHMLIFDRLAIPNLIKGFMENAKIKSEHPEAVNELGWLLEAGLIFDYKIEEGLKPSSPEGEEAFEATALHGLLMVGALVGLDPRELIQAEVADNSPSISDVELDELSKRLKKLPEYLKKTDGKVLESPEFINQVRLMMRHLTRMSSIVLRDTQGLDAYPVLSATIPNSIDSPAIKSDVVRIVLNALPIPDDSTSWQDILEYRNDPESQGKFLALRSWMSDIARQNFTITEVEEKLDHLLYEYQKHLELHHIKANKGTLETIIVSSAEFLEDLANRKFSKIAMGLFTAKQRRIELLEGELTAPGREVAYIASAMETFS